MGCPRVGVTLFPVELIVIVAAGVVVKNCVLLIPKAFIIFPVSVISGIFNVSTFKRWVRCTIFVVIIVVVVVAIIRGSLL